MWPGRTIFIWRPMRPGPSPGEDGTMLVVSSTQHPSEVQTAVAGVLGCQRQQGDRASAAHGRRHSAARKHRRPRPRRWRRWPQRRQAGPVRVRWNRDQDMMLTGKRHPFLARFSVGFDDDGLLHAAKMDLFSNGGWALDLSSRRDGSRAVSPRQRLLHSARGIQRAGLQNEPRFEHRFPRLRRAAGNAGHGGNHGSRGAPARPAARSRARAKSLSRASARQTPRITDRRSRTIASNHLAAAQANESISTQRRRELAEWNRTRPHRKRGLAITPVKFGISFTTTPLNHAGALVLLYLDGSVQVNHGGTEMGQGVHTNIIAIAARELGVTPDKDPGDAHQHGQDPEHLGHRGFVRHRSERRGG